MIQLHERIKVRRVFFHELGHYVAAKLNQKYFSGLGSEHIKIYRCPKKYDEFCGEMEPIKPEKFNAGDLFFERLSENLVGLIYGCVFQSYFSESSTLNFCFEHFGIDDMYSFNGHTAKHKLDSLKVFKLRELYDEHYIRIFSDRDLELLRKIDYMSLLIPTKVKEDEYFINLSTLDSLLEEFLVNFKDTYCNLVVNFEKIIAE